MKRPAATRVGLGDPLETARFILRPLGYIEAFRLTASWRNDPEVLIALFQSLKPRSLRKWMRSPLLPRPKVRFAYAIIDRESGRSIGVHTVALSGYRSAYFTVAVSDRDWWGKGAVLETRATLINHFIRHAGTERFFGMVHGRNLSSIFNYQRLGFSHVGSWHRHKQDPVSGEIFDVVLFELFREQWQAGPFAEAIDEP
ncbi:RimJ/RimL family protein N-acetyltransferase [Hoeflea marina]|uniref:RimJ/RimL family protein N-acetyltransferase n=1 Tax=Hoeflea marina TaxID=274592 RepID=A0A317PQ58_9HYPH|nr:GNAT family protein [Hoeflea marina]PWW01720.1 RimJ/RimL family protein N-acetyltransferase [Hoeflea marina]